MQTENMTSDLQASDEYGNLKNWDVRKHFFPFFLKKNLIIIIRMIMRIITVYVMIIIQSFVKIGTPVVEAIHTDIYTHAKL